MILTKERYGFVAEENSSGCWTGGRTRGGIESYWDSSSGVGAVPGEAVSGFTVDGEVGRMGCELVALTRREEGLGDERRNDGSVSGAGCEDERRYILAVSGASKRVMTGGTW